MTYEQNESDACLLLSVLFLFEAGGTKRKMVLKALHNHGKFSRHCSLRYVVCFFFLYSVCQLENWGYGIGELFSVWEYTLKQKWKWGGQQARMKDNRWTKRCTEWQPKRGKRWRGWPSRRWQDDIAEKEGTTWIREATDDNGRHWWRATSCSGWTKPSGNVCTGCCFFNEAFTLLGHEHWSLGSPWDEMLTVTL